ncbi:hypothetical protein K435DRAFT_802401 [Dendrothele bispora CBS 962.96]|uniref:Uncharacterized protein n=1 Tax=Dendrothele bispora (strain CBS 962.96) TaxID=1314807 RepID=A0A4S8LLK2_DENBC|nr:hypothetical protein K435DRAFT_802401 [Dendrothele bispora CBS 962.96]
MQYYGFSQSSSDLEEKEECLSELGYATEEVENRSDKPKLELEDYDGIALQSQLLEEFKIPADKCDHFYVPDAAFTHQTSQVSVDSSEWIPNVANQKKIDDLLLTTMANQTLFMTSSNSKTILHTCATAGNFSMKTVQSQTHLILPFFA